MLYFEAIQYLYDLQFFGAKLGLENTRELAALAGNPQQRLRFIHVAGTNGKGSTCAMLESVYRHAGLKVGLFTSPHLVAFGERIQVNRQLIPESDVVRLVERIREMLAPHAASFTPTFFEVVTIMALIYFAERECDLVIWETGLGGRLDATNIVTPLASVITNIQLDHEKWLGETLERIAFEKAGIIKEGIPVVTTESKPVALRVIAETARQKKAPLTLVSPEQVKQLSSEGASLSLAGEHQRSNAALVFAIIKVLSETLPVNSSAIQAGLSSTHWPGRFQRLHPGPGQAIVLDGAHNPAGAEALRTALQHYYPGTLASLIFGVMGDKDWATMCRVLAPLSGRICLAPVNSQRTAQPEVLGNLCRELNPYAEVSVFDSLEEAFRHVKQDPLIVITGSLHFIGQAIEFLKISPAPPTNERGLNEWSGSREPNQKV